MINFKYIIGANIELDVVARIIPDEPEVNFTGGAEIESVKLNGLYVETDDIFIKQSLFISEELVTESLDSLLEAEAIERAAGEE